jgi:hypothetical protein
MAKIKLRKLAKVVNENNFEPKLLGIGKWTNLTKTE